MSSLALTPPPQPSEWTDHLLLQHVLHRDDAAWSELVRRYRLLIYRCITRTMGKLAPAMTSADIDEIYADVLLGLIRNDMHKLRQYDPGRGTKLGTWIGLITINATYDFLRSVGRMPIIKSSDGVAEERIDTEPTPLGQLLEKERWSHLNELLAAFSPKDRQFLDLYYARGLTPAAVADEMSISLKTVYSKKHKIRAHLQRCVDKLRGESAIADLAPAATC